MIKISALNKESEEESHSEEEVTREALEQIALQQYAKALELQRKGNTQDATQLLKDLLDTEIIDEVKKPAQGEKVTGPLLNLKYLCYKNLASILSTAGEVGAAINAYCVATELDDTDVTIWHRLGLLCLRAQRYEMALQAFQRGTEQNPKHWPCLDKIITLLLGLDYKDECIATIYDALELDPGYLRGLAYRKYIYTTYSHVRDFMEYCNPCYKWNENNEYMIDEEKAEKLLKEAKDIKETFLAQQKAQQLKYVLPVLKLNKPITNLTWEAVGESLILMHEYMEINGYSHACPIEIIYEKQERAEAKLESDEIIKEAEQKDFTLEEQQIEIGKTCENVIDNENNDASDKTLTEEKFQMDVEHVIEPMAESAPEPKKKSSVRRRGSALSFLEQWEWCTKRRSGRKKTANRHDDDNIYEILRRMVPAHLAPGTGHKEDKNAGKEDVPIEVPTTIIDSSPAEEKGDYIKDDQYFGTDSEQQEVEQFITKYTETKKDIIDILQDYLLVLSQKMMKWPGTLPKIFIKANECYKAHKDIPACVNDNHDELIHYTLVNLMVEEFSVSEKLLLMTTEDKQQHDLCVIESIGVIITLRPFIFTKPNILDLTIRHHWVKLHIHILNKYEEIALDYLYQLSHEFEAMGEHEETFALVNDNFTFKPVINQFEISTYIKFLERNKELSKVMELYERGCYEEVLSIVVDSFEHCKNLAKNQEDEMSLDFAVQLSLILDTLWALDRVDSCLQWSLICLHEALKHYFRLTSASSDYEKWTMAVVKILSCMEHILTNEGLTCLDSASAKELSQGLEDLIRIIGHQVETNAAEMPFGTIVPWIIMHYILQREEDQARQLGRAAIYRDRIEQVPNSLMVLFIAHDNLGNREWCCKSDGKLLYFILDTVAHRLRSPSLSKCLEQVCQYMEQCVYCLYGHPGRKNKVKYLADHNVTPHTLDWKRAQQLYEIFRPPTLPLLEGKVSGISGDTKQLFRQILKLLPPEYDPDKYVPEIEKYIEGTENKLLTTPPLLPYKMRDIYFLLGDYYFKNKDVKRAIKYNILDVIVNRDRLESWAEISLAKGLNLERILNSCKNLNNMIEILDPAKAIIRCYKRALEIDPTHCNLWTEYGMFAYTIHSFCSRFLRQASQSLSMEHFESLEKQKEELLDTTYKCFRTALDLNDSEKTNEDLWLYYYMLGKIGEKRNKPPTEYLKYYLQGVKSLQEAKAIYPLKINYNSPAHSSIEVLELHYRIHASILKYIEQHENKTIALSVGKMFLSCIEEWKKGPFSKKLRKEHGAHAETHTEKDSKTIQEPIHAANILKRSVSDVGEEDTREGKKWKLEVAAAKVKRSASYGTERINTDPSTENETQTTNKEAEPKNTVFVQEEPIVVDTPSPAPSASSAPEETNTIQAFNKTDNVAEPNKVDKIQNPNDTELVSNIASTVLTPNKVGTGTEPIEADSVPEPKEANIVPPLNKTETLPEHTKVDKGPAEMNLSAECNTWNEETCSTSTRCSSSDSSSSDSSSDTSCDDLTYDSDDSSKSSSYIALSDEEITKIVIACIEALEDCACRLSPHYKAIYRLAHYHFYNKNGKDIERCRDLMLSTCTSRTGQKLGGLFSERKTSNFFNNVWKIPKLEVDRAGGFVFHMSRSAQLTMEILKEIDDHKTLLDLSLYLQRIPEPDKKYLRDSDREELAQQALILCVQSLKGQLQKFNQQADLRSNEIERQALKSLMLDIYRANTRYHKQLSPNIKSAHFTNLLADAYKLITTTPVPDNVDLVDLSTKYCHSLQQALRQQATQASLDKSQQQQKRHTAKTASAATFIEPSKLPTASSSNAPNTTTSTVPKTTTVPTYTTSSSLPKMTDEMAAVFQSFLPVLNNPISPQTAAAITYLSNLGAIAGYPSLQSTLPTSLQNSLPNSFQAEFYRQFLKQSLPSYLPPPKKLKRGPKPKSSNSALANQPKSFNTAPTTQSNSFNSAPDSQAKSSNSDPSAQARSFKRATAKGKSYNIVPTIQRQSFNSSPVTQSKSFSGPTTHASKMTTNSGISSSQKSIPASLAPTMGKVLPSLPLSMTANLSCFGASTSNAEVTNMPSQAHMSTSTAPIYTTAYIRPPSPHQPVIAGKTLQEKLAERLKNLPNISKDSFVANKLPASLIITKAAAPKPVADPNEVIVLDDD